MESQVYFPQVGCSVHPDIKGKDFHTIKKGDNAFVSIDGNGNEVSIPLAYPIKDGKEMDDKKQQYMMFIEEASYVTKNIAFALQSKQSKPIF